LDDSRAVGYADNTIAQMARRGRIDRVSQGVYLASDEAAFVTRADAL
jgi:predicted transcriptional regulator of viral defense system